MLVPMFALCKNRIIRKLLNANFLSTAEYRYFINTFEYKEFTRIVDCNIIIGHEQVHITIHKHILKNILITILVIGWGFLRQKDKNSKKS